MHKEELTQSKTEKDIKRRIEENAATKQQKKTDSLQQSSATISGGLGPVPAPTVAESSPSTSQQKRVRVSTSDGRQLTINLEDHLTYTALLSQLEKEFEVSRERMKIRYGIPPKDLRPVVSGDEEVALPLQHGDRITVEITANQPGK
jgi:deubiquitinating protein VCIP135